ncbi:LysR family transcriptional regulator [Oceanimonas sp. CAM02]|uniref:LysR family transcriptional regulator n=1 Tax=Oceanimonas sp. CAM02 TaxID=3080336 RepID=UPI002936266B|nr:LysR family transcriptional regulator [Oceanimonas sp. CAM02]MDV2857158.1 LysR family transcriptional regulator [Oceanimonas sp. CAM02]
MIDWEGINEFVSVVESESFTAAAQRLNVSVAHVSRRVNQLEKRLGAKLLYRTTRKLTLTDTGRVYYRQVCQIKHALQAAEQEVMTLEGNPAGRLRITAPVYYGEQFVAPLVNNFLLRYPGLQLDMVLTNSTVDLVQEGFDLAIRLGSLGSSSLMCRKLARRTQFLCASPDYLARYGTPRHINDLSTHRCLAGTVDHWRFIENQQPRRFRLPSGWHCNSGLALKDAAIKGLGIVQLPDYYVTEALNKGLLVSLLEEYRVPDDGVWVVYPNNKHLSPRVRLLVDYLVECL